MSRLVVCKGESVEPLVTQPLAMATARSRPVARVAGADMVMAAQAGGREAS